MEKEKEEKEEEEKNTTAPSENKKTAAATTTTTTTATTKKKAPMKLDKVKKVVLGKRSEEALERKKKKFTKKKMKKKEDMNQNKPKEGEEEEGEGAAAAEEEEEEEEEEQQPDVEKLKDLKKKKTNRDLKRGLARNGFAMSGDYNALLQKYLEGSKHGGLPKCPNCKRFGLSVKLDKSTINGEVRCPGRFDRATNSFQKCPFVSTLAQIERPAWEEEEEKKEKEEEKEEGKEKEKEEEEGKEKEKEKEGEETRTKTTEEKQPLEASLSEDEWKEFQVLENKFNRQKIKSEDLKDAICSMIKSKGLVVGGDKTDVGFFIARVLFKNTRRSSLRLRPAIDEILKKYPKAGTDKVANEENNAIVEFLSKLEAHAKVAAAKEKEEEEENVAPTLDAKTVAIVKKGLIEMRKFPHRVNTEAMVDAMMKGGVVNGVDVKKISGFGDSVANLIKFWIKNQAEEKSALIEMALSQIQEYAQKKKKQTTAKPEEQAAAAPKKQAAAAPKKQAAATTKKQAAATTKKQAAATTKKQAAATTKKQAAAATKKQAAAATMKRKEKPTKSPTKVSPAEKKTKVAQSQRNANED